MEMLCSVGRMVDISEPVLAEDSSFSRLALSLTAVLEQLDKRDDVTTQDYLVALLLVLLAESGFRVASVSNSSTWEQNTRMVHIPADWKTSEKNTQYKISLVLNNLQDTQSDLIVFHLKEKLVVNLCWRRGEQHMCSMIVETLKYVNPHTCNPCFRYINLKDISHRFKDQLCTPIRSNILSALNLSNPSFLGLPSELQIEIISMLDSWEIGRLAQCSKALHDICSDPILKVKLSKRRPKIEEIVEIAGIAEIAGYCTPSSPPAWSSFFSFLRHRHAGLRGEGSMRVDRIPVSFRLLNVIIHHDKVGAGS